MKRIGLWLALAATRLCSKVANKELFTTLQVSLMLVLLHGTNFQRSADNTAIFQCLLKTRCLISTLLLVNVIFCTLTQRFDTFGWTLGIMHCLPPNSPQ